MSATQIKNAVASGSLSCEAVARDCLERISARDGTLNAFAFVDPDLVLKQAKELDSLGERGALHGVPIGIKDVIITSDMPTGMGSPIFENYLSFEDASCVSQLRTAGALIIGKTVTCEFAGPAPSSTLNPHNLSRTPGGSSSGSAAAVADFMVPLALGTQTGGSVVRPSSFCGIVGFKPSFGLINTHGVKPAAASLDTVGVMGRCVEDIELTFRVLTGAEPLAVDSEERPIRIGLCRTYAWTGADACSREAVEDAARRLASAGFHIEELDLPASSNDLPVTREIINDYERARAMAWEWKTHRRQISPRLSRALENGLKIPLDRYLDALKRVALCRVEASRLFDKVDLLLTPSANGEALSGLEDTGDHRFQSIWTQLRTPSIHLPTCSGPTGMPVGIQLVGRYQEDLKLLAIAQRVLSLLGSRPCVAV